MSLRLYDTAARAPRDFTPLEPGRVGLYICGLTVQGEPHIGHLRFAVAFDQLRRWLVAGHGYDVVLVRNVTDIDDKILARSAEAGQPWWAWAFRHERATTAALDALGVLPPTYEPRATGHVPEMLELLEALVDRGHAYPAPDGSGDVYFDVRSWPSYGELTHQRLEDLAPAEDADPRGKRDPRDFALWKGAKDGEPASASWPTRYGRGRPGWHLECSAMARKYLGDTFDVHGGGIDLRFPHHENEQAQSRAAGLGFARYWMHNAWVTTGGEKMSKSLGNSLTVPAVLERARPLALRYYLGSAHYRSTIEYTDHSLAEAESAVQRVEGFLVRAAGAAGAGGRGDGAGPGDGRAAGGADAFPADFAAAMDDDLNVAGALAVLHETVRRGNAALDAGDAATVAGSATAVRAMAGVLGIDPGDPQWSGPTAAGRAPAEAGALAVLVEAELEARSAARAARDWAAADAIRDRLTAAGVVVEDTPVGARWSLAHHPSPPIKELPADQGTP